MTTWNPDNIVRIALVDYVPVSDADEAVRQAHQRGMRTTGHYRLAYENGQRDAFRAALRALQEAIPGTGACDTKHKDLQAIRDLLTDDTPEEKM